MKSSENKNDGWLPIGTDSTQGWYFKDALDRYEIRIEKFQPNFSDETGEPVKQVVDFYDGRLYKK